MPYIARGNEPNENRNQTLASTNIDYDYPFELDLDPKGELHKKLLGASMCQMGRFF